jgi:hypothetical protein
VNLRMDFMMSRAGRGSHPLYALKRVFTDLFLVTEGNTMADSKGARK